MKTNFWLTACGALMMNALVSCNTNDDVLSTNELQPPAIHANLTLSESKAQETFARILSRAVAKEASLRKFLKEEALKQYDKDYDVFYPYVKDQVVANGKTLRDFLISYSSEQEMKSIERSSLLLTMMIPNLSNFNAFNVEEWDTADNQVAVTYSTGNEESVFYAEGDSLLSLPQGNLPSFPFIVVKSNERMKVVSQVTTRGLGEISCTYDFANPEFDGSKNPTTRASYYDEDNSEQAPDSIPYLKASEIDYRCVEAYNLVNKDKALIAREYIYYNLSPSNKENGILDHNIKEKLYKFRIRPEKYYSLSDDDGIRQKDPKILPDVFYKKGHPSHEQIARELWTDGAFEFVFHIYMGNTNLVETKIIPLRGNDVFYISKFHVRYKHKTAFRHSKWWYTTTIGDLKARWVDVSNSNLYITSEWDLTKNPLNVYINMLEADSGTMITMTEQYDASYTLGFNMGSDLTSKKSNNKLTLGFSAGVTETKSKTISYQYTEKDDPLGTIHLNFKDPIITSDKEANTKGYNIYSLNTGACELVIAPTAIR